MSIKTRFQLYVKHGEVLTIGRTLNQVPTVGEHVVYAGWQYIVTRVIWKLDTPSEDAIVFAEGREGYYE